MIQKHTFIWRIYFFVLISTALFLVLVAWLEWEDIVESNTSELGYINHIHHNSLRSELNQLTVMLRILGRQLLDSRVTDNPKNGRYLIDKLLEDNPLLAGFGLAQPDGKLVLTSSNLKTGGRVINLLKQKGSADTFREALNSEHMVVGRTYFFKPLDQWIIPIRYALRDKQGKVQAVMTSGLKLESPYSLWHASQLPENVELVILRKDFYVQYRSDNWREVKQLLKTNTDASEIEREHPEFSQPVNQNVVGGFIHRLKQQKGITLKQLRESGELYSVVAVPNLGGESKFTIQFEPRYGFYSIVFMPVSAFYPILWERLKWVVWLFVALNIILFGLSFNTARAQHLQRKELSHQARHDQLTGLPNRYFLKERFKSWVKEHQKHFSILFLDLNNFKAINDNYGHSLGDHVLREISRRIQASFDDNCLKIRQGGDEFIILLPESNFLAVNKICEKLIKNLKLPICIDSFAFSIDSSIGVVHAPEHGEDMDTLLSKADIAMYKAKELGSNICLFTSVLEEENRQQVAIEHALPHALDNRELFLVYQPQIDSEKNTILGVEALLRWESSELGFIGPDTFIPIAESMGLISEIGMFVLHQALKDLVKLQQQMPELRMSVNVSAVQLQRDNFYDDVVHLLNELNADKNKLTIEVTESLFIEDVEHAKKVLKKFRELGIKVALDDFGTGYSSLGMLGSLPIDELKIDRCFVNDILTNAQDRQLIDSIITIGKNMNMVLLAEGVEEQGQVEMLVEMGCVLFQGYYFTRPLPFDELEQFIQDFPTS